MLDLAKRSSPKAFLGLLLNAKTYLVEQTKALTKDLKEMTTSPH